jgi:hypothetical protein
VQWYGDLLGLAFFVFMLAGGVNLATGGGQLFRKLTAFLLATVPVLVALGLLRAVALVRRGTGASWRDAIGAFFVWQSTSLVVARASVQGLFARKAAFLRTPKTSEDSPWWQSFRANWAETGLALLGVLGIAGALTRTDTDSGPLLAALLLFPTLGLAAAPFNSLAARRAALPADLSRRRTSEWRRDRWAIFGTATAGGTVAVFGVLLVAIVALLLSPSPDRVSPPHLTPHGPHHHGTRTPGPSPSPSPERPSDRRSPAESPTDRGGPPSREPSPSRTPAPSRSTGPSRAPSPSPSSTGGSGASTANGAPTS